MEQLHFNGRRAGLLSVCLDFVDTFYSEAVNLDVREWPIDCTTVSTITSDFKRGWQNMILERELKFRTRANMFQVGLWGFMLTLLAGTGSAVWVGTPFFPALRQAQMQFAPLLKSGDAAAYPSYVAQVRSAWPKFLAAFPRDLSLTVEVLLFFLFALLVFSLVKWRTVGRPIAKPTPHKQEVLKRATELANFKGKVLERTDDQPDAVSLHGNVYLPQNWAQWLNRKAMSDADVQIGFLISHERFHSRSWDNALWSLGTIITMATMGLLTALVGQFAAFAVVIVLPDAVFRSAPSWLGYGLVAIATLVVVSLFAATIAGVATSFIGGREFFADFSAQMVTAVRRLPYMHSDDPAGVGTWLEPWRTACAPADRRLHVRGAFPRAPALLACCLGSWALIRVLLAIVSGLQLEWITLGFDLPCMIWLALLVWAMPRHAPGLREYRLAPGLLILFVIGSLGGMMLAIDGFAQRFGLAPFFDTPTIVWTAAMPFAVGALLLAFRHLTRQKAIEGELEIDGLPPRMSLRELLLFFTATPAWVVSLACAGACLFVLATSLSPLVIQPNLVPLITVSYVSVLAVCLALLVLFARNLRRPTPRFVALELGTAVLIVFGMLVINLAMFAANAAHPPQIGEGPVDMAVLVGELSSARPWLQAVLPAAACGLIVAASWLARYQLKRWLRET